MPANQSSNATSSPCYGGACSTWLGPDRVRSEPLLHTCAMTRVILRVVESCRLPRGSLCVPCACLWSRGVRLRELKDQMKRFAIAWDCAGVWIVKRFHLYLQFCALSSARAISALEWILPKLEFGSACMQDLIGEDCRVKDCNKRLPQ